MTLIQRLTIVLALLAIAWPSKPSLGQESSRQLRVLTYNIHHGEGTDGQFDYDRLAGVIKALNPDLIALQEVDRKTRRASGVDQAARLGKRLDMEYSFGRAMYYSGGEYGEAILSRFPIERVWNHSLPYRVGQEPRAALAIRVSPPGNLPKVIFVGTHLCHQSSKTRLEQTRQLSLLFSTKDKVTTILAGDLNARPESAPMRELIADGWIDAVAPQSRIDYVLFRKDDPWVVKEVVIVPDDVTSDHRPVLVVLEWNPADSSPAASTDRVSPEN